MSLFRVTISGIEGLKQELNQEVLNISTTASNALLLVGAEMRNRLKFHIDNDWYHQYEPRVYKRRTDRPQYGTPLGDDKNIDDVVTGLKLEFSYEPTGEHSVEHWHARDGDELIEFIQLGDLNMPPRPFWNNFVDEMRNGAIIKAFADAMHPYNLIYDNDDVEFAAGESMLAGGIQIFENTTEAELPF